MIDALKDIKNWDEELEYEWEDCGYRAIDALSKFSDMDEIQLPSDEEIEKRIVEQGIVVQEGYCHCFIEGAKWIKEQILNQNK